MADPVQVPTGTLAERLTALAHLHRRNAALCTPPVTGNRAVLEVASRHMLIHEQAYADILEAVALLRKPADG